MSVRDLCTITFKIMLLLSSFFCRSMSNQYLSSKSLWKSILYRYVVNFCHCVNFSERSCEKKVDPFAQVKSWLSNDNSAHACSDHLVVTELTRLGEPECVFGEKFARLGEWPYHRKGRVTLLAEPTFVSHVNGSSNFVRKCRKSWLI